MIDTAIDGIQREFKVTLDRKSKWNNNLSLLWSKCDVSSGLNPSNVGVGKWITTGCLERSGMKIFHHSPG